MSRAPEGHLSARRAQQPPLQGIRCPRGRSGPPSGAAMGCCHVPHRRSVFCVCITAMLRGDCRPSVPDCRPSTAPPPPPPTRCGPSAPGSRSINPQPPSLSPQPPRTPLPGTHTSTTSQCPRACTRGGWKIAQKGGGGPHTGPVFKTPSPKGAGAVLSGHYWGRRSCDRHGTSTTNNENGFFGISALREGGVRKWVICPAFDEKKRQIFLPNNGPNQGP